MRKSRGSRIEDRGSRIESQRRFPILDPRSSILDPRSLLRWFAGHRRDLPWRRDRDPYRIWVSEAMLQQTQVATVIPFFERFLAAFPTLADLAAAEEQTVLRLWEGLGYYRRARHLHQAAQRLMAEHAGLLPDDPAVWRDLPGVGRYMLGAILSQSFDRRLPIVEVNSQRVLCRFFGQTGDPRRGAGQRWLWETAEAILPKQQVGEFNQALMELGALVCTSTAPRCEVCPLARACLARRLGQQETIPPRAVPPSAIEVQEVAVVVRRGRQVLLVQRPETGRWAGLWEFPHAEREDGMSHEGAAGRIVSSLTGLRAHVGGELITLRHGVTRYRITLVCFEARYRSGTFRSEFYRTGVWVEPGELHSYPVSSPQRRLAQAVIAPSGQKLLFP